MEHDLKNNLFIFSIPSSKFSLGFASNEEVLVHSVLLFSAANSSVREDQELDLSVRWNSNCWIKHKWGCYQFSNSDSLAWCEIACFPFFRENYFLFSQVVNNLFTTWWLNSDCHLLAGLTFLSVSRNSPLFFVFKFLALVWQTNPNKVFPSLEETYPLEEGSQAALQTPAASEVLWCSAVDCAPKEGTIGGGPAEICFNSASCQLPEGEHWLGTVVPWAFCCAVRNGTNPVWIGRRKGYPMWNSVM